MASFTDTQTPKFNPYIAQQPVEAMVSVGMQKQKAHDEGVQKIQTQVDNLASIDVGRDVDKAYLQSKINELGNNLRTVAAGDFGNFQLVNSVGGMVKQIGYDPYIRTAVASKANDNKQMEQMEADRKEGKLTPHAEYFYGMKRNKYYNNNSLKGEGGKPIGFSGKYVQSWDIDKNILESIKAVGDKKWSADNVFKMVNGQIAKDKNGIPIYSDYAIREIKEGRFEDSVSAAIDEVLNRPEAKQELTMRGVYNYRGYDDINDFIRGYEKEKNTNIANYESKKLEMMEKVANARTSEEKAAYQAQVNQIDSKIESTKQETELKENQALEFGSLEGYKAALETLRIKNSYMKSGVTETIRTEIIENIPYKAAQDRLKAERDWKMQLDTSARGWKGLSLEEQKMGFEALKWSQHADNITNKPGGGADLALPTGATFETQHGQLMDAAVQAEQTMESTKFSIVSEYLSAINYGNGKTYTPAQLEASIKKYEKNDPGFIDRMYGKAKNIANDGKLSRNPLYSKLMSALPMAAQAEGSLDEVSRITKNMNDSAEVIAAGGKEVDLGAISKTFKPFEVEYVTDTDKPGLLGFGGTEGGWMNFRKTTKTITAQDALDLAIIAKNTGGLKGAWKSFTNSPAEEKQYESAQNRIKNKFDVDGKVLLNEMSSGEMGRLLTGAPVYGGIHPEMRKVMNVAESYKFDNVMKAKEDYLTKHNVVPQSLAYNVYDPNMKGIERTSTDDRVKDVLNKYKSVGGVDEFNNLYTDKKNYTVQIGVGRGTVLNPKENFTLNLYDANNIVKSVPISRDDAEYIKQYKIDLPSAATEVNQRLQANNGTTNSSGLSPNNPNAYRSAMFPSTYFTQKLNTTKVLGADVIQSPSGGYNVYLYGVDPGTGDKMGVPVKGSSDDIYPASFETADAAQNFISTKITSKAYAEGLLKNGSGL